MSFVYDHADQFHGTQPTIIIPKHFHMSFKDIGKWGRDYPLLPAKSLILSVLEDALPLQWTGDVAAFENDHSPLSQQSGDGDIG
jgi:hypothetical protein